MTPQYAPQEPAATPTATVAAASQRTSGAGSFSFNGRCRGEEGCIPSDSAVLRSETRQISVCASFPHLPFLQQILGGAPDATTEMAGGRRDRRGRGRRRCRGGVRGGFPIAREQRRGARQRLRRRGGSRGPEHRRQQSRGNDRALRQ